MKGLFITIEGGEGAGKTTLTKKLSLFFQEELKREVLVTREPGGTPFGCMLRSILLDKDNAEISDRAETLTFLADRANHVDKLIVPALQNGKVVICDRFTDSTIAYQGGARQIDSLQGLCHFATGGLEPKITFLLDIDPKIGLKRAANVSSPDRFEKEDLAFHEMIRNEFLKIAHDHPKRICLLDATNDPETISKEAISYLKQRL